jgi:hypothetical protein
LCNKKPVVDGPVFGSISIHSFVDTSIECLADVVRVPDQVLDLFFSISLLLPKPVGAEASENRQASYAAVTDLEDLIAVTNWDATGDELEVLRHIVHSVGILLTTEEVCKSVLQSLILGNECDLAFWCYVMLVGHPA